MYTNIDTITGVNAVKNFIQVNRENIPHDFPCNLFLQVLVIVMQNNIFSFSNTYWLQISGTAMGTPVACAYATVTVGHYENTTILNEFASQLIYYWRYIDDIIGIWLPPEHDQATTWNRFKETLNNWGGLQWKYQEPSKKTLFLNLESELHNSSITTRTFQKKMNLYLYIPPLSAYPPGCLKGLITGESCHYWLQNNQMEFQNILCKFIERLTERGHTLENLKPILEQAALHLDRHFQQPVHPAASNENAIFLHRTYHPYGPGRSTIRHLYQWILEHVLNYDRMIIATARPSNLCDLLTRSKLTLPDNVNMQNIIDEISTDNP